MLVEIDYKGAGLNFRQAVANALHVALADVWVSVAPSREFIPFRCDWRVVTDNRAADVVCYVRGELLKLNIV